MATSTPACGTEIEEQERSPTQTDLPMRFNPTHVTNAQGEFLKDRKDGEGTYKLPSGNTYTGTYKVSFLVHFVHGSTDFLIIE